MARRTAVAPSPTEHKGASLHTRGCGRFASTKLVQIFQFFARTAWLLLRRPQVGERGLKADLVADSAGGLMLLITRTGLQ